ncbi:PREDICTED: mannose-P-dolichol utilization defect 1 protein-like [Amphimedon queenslandica]|uniref:Mannose-P-dolichol utilization defect 1 protein homolog n=1 Tax=Amphimedon queenslandica TaxID=400682 RepID=A0A1X7UHB3_AMPQE|nr:PREDICTED: mannose-P-dolichol utilization defect 1 protein-like [Amphimedon queenslandica]|eukprot:XP_019854065.1 PREDICTED: mannose-P-dolichol utilization defect 1 protein-like [Amphimedon queenslandica]
MDALFSYFFPGDCYVKVFQEYQFFNRECLTIALSRWLSLSVILGALGVKFPQIYKIVKNYSTESISYLACILELGAVTFSSTYNYEKGFPFSTWGESFFISVQVLIILILMAVIRQHVLIIAPFLIAYSAGVWFLVSGLAPGGLNTTLQAIVIPLMLASRLTTVLTVYNNGSTGQLSFITAFLNFIGNIARVFTTIQETGDLLLMATFISSLTLNSIIVLQFLWYWNATAKQSRKRD